MTAVMAFLYVIAWFEFCCRKIFYFSFAVSRLVIVICLSAIISKVYFAQRTINSKYDLVQQYNWAYEHQCGDPNSVMDAVNIQKSLG
jgi:hypothetical protein